VSSTLDHGGVLYPDERGRTQWPPVQAFFFSTKEVKGPHILRVGMKTIEFSCSLGRSSLEMNEKAFIAVPLMAKVRLKRTFSVFFKVSLLRTLISAIFVRHERSKTR
jgi:hypothetical protein